MSKKERTNKIIVLIILIVVLSGLLLGYYTMRQSSKNNNMENIDIEEPQKDTSQEVEKEEKKVYSSNEIMEYGPLVVDLLVQGEHNFHSISEYLSPSEQKRINSELENVKKKIKNIENKYGVKKNSEIVIPSSHKEKRKEYQKLLERKRRLDFKLFKAHVNAVELSFKNTSDETVVLSGQYILKDGNNDNEIIESYSLQTSKTNKENSIDYMQMVKRKEGVGGEKIAPGEKKSGYLFYDQQIDIKDLILELDLFEKVSPIEIALDKVKF